GFKTGDVVRAIVPSGKQIGTHVGRVAVRANGYFRVGSVDGISWRHCRMIQINDGYAYSH
ncbi:MAG: HNH endonuclease, partial [Anaerolineae bacterium]|nr:HNH endonuclease [Anaerolineae bacterium]